MGKRWPKLLLTILSITAGVFILAFLLLLTPPAKNFAFEQLRNYLQSHSRIDLQASRMQLDLFRGTMSLENPIIRSVSEPGLPPLFKAERILIKLDIFALFWGQRIVEELNFTAPQINYFVGQNGETNWPKSPSTSGSVPDFLILHAKAKDGSLSFENLPQEISSVIPQWQLSINGNQETLEHHIAFTSRGKSIFRYRDHTIPIDSLQLSGTLQETAVQIDQAQAVTAASRISVTGSLNDFSKPSINLKFTTDIELSEIARIMNFEEKAQGSVTGSIQASGEIREPRITVQLKGSDVTIREYKQAGFDLKAQAQWERDSGKLTVENLDLASSYGSLSARAEFFTGSAEGINTVEARIENLDLLPIWKQLKPPFDLASRSSGRISLQWKGAFTPSRVIGRAHLMLVATRPNPTLNLLPISGMLDAQMQSNRIVGNLTSFAVLGTEVSGQFSLTSFQDIEGDFQGDAPDIDILMGQLSQFLGMPDYLFGIRMTGPIRLNVQASEKLRQPKIVARLNAPLLQLGGLKNLKASAEASIKGTQIDFQNTVILPQNSTVWIQGNLGLGGEKTLLNLGVRTDPIPIAALCSILDKDLPITGNLKASLHVNGTMDNLEGSASVEGDALALYQVSLGHLETDLRIAGKTIQSTHFKLLRDSRDPSADYVDGKFLYALDSHQFQFQADGKDLALKLLLPGGVPVQGSMNFLATGMGTTEQPSVVIEVESDNISVGQKSIGPVSGNATLRDRQTRIEARIPRINVTLSAVIANSDLYQFRGELKAQNSDLSMLGLKWINEQPLTGMVDADLTASGDLKDLAQAHISARIQRAQFQAGELEMHTQGPMQIEYRDNLFAFISAASIVSGKSALEITGGLPILESAPADTLRLKGQIDLAQVMGWVPTPEGFAVTGTLNLDLSLSGTPQQLHSTGIIRLNDGTVDIPKVATPLRNVTLLANVQEGSLVLQQADAAWGQGRLRLTGTLPFGFLTKSIPVQFEAKEGPARFVLDLIDVRPEATGMLPEGIEGNISLHATGETAGTDLRLLKARIDLQDLSLKIEDIAFKQREPGIISVQDGIASIKSLSLIGPQTDINMSGSAGLYRDGPLNLRLAGDFDAALLTSTSQDLKAAGKVQIQVAVAGNRDSPTLSGHAETNSGKLSLRNPRVVADSLTLRLDFTSNEISIQQFSGTLNGGSLDVRGTIGYERGTLNNFNLNAKLQDVFLNFPEGLKSASGGSLKITSSDDSIIVSGNIRALESSYREPLEVGGQVMDYLRSQQVLQIGQEFNPLLERIRFNISFRTDTPLLVQNNIAKVEATANLTIIGTFYEPSIIGRISLNEGGEIILNQRSYYLNRGAITLANQSHIEPDLNIQAQTKVSTSEGTYDITLQMTGTPDRLTTTLSSEPPRSEPDILSLLLTGKTVSQTEQGGGMQMVRTQALSLIAGQAGEEVAREARQVLHLSTFRIDPGLIASESDPGARITLGEDITKDFSLAYSMNLVNGGDQIWIAQYNFPRRLATQATRQQDNSYRLELRQDLRLGGPSRRRSSRSSSERFQIGFIQFHGENSFSDKILLDKLKIKPGDKYDFSKVQKGLDHLHDFYASQKRLEADISMHRETQKQTVNLDLSIDPGPIVDFSFDGMPISGDVRKKVEEAWRNGVFETERFDDAVMAIRRPLFQAGFLQSEVTHTVGMENGQKLVHFQVTPGTRYGKVEITFPGASEIAASKLSNALELADLKVDVFVDPQKVVDFLQRYYHEKGYLQARVDLPRLELDPEAGFGQAAIHIQEGPLFTIGELEFKGNNAFDYDQLWSVIPTSSGSRYDPNTLRDAVKALQNLYHSKGYNDVTITFRIVQDSEGAHANVTFQITERKQSIIREIAIEGNRATSQTFVRRQLDFQVGDALDFMKIDVTRKRLYATGVYTSVDFQTEEIPATEPDSHEKNVRIRIRLRETQPYRLQYGLFYDTERGPGGLVEVQNLNLMGRAANLGLRLRYDSDLKEGRIYFNQPFVTKIHVKMNASAFIQRETRPYFSANRIGFSLFREKSLPKEFRFDYGYRYDHVRWDGLAPDPTLYQSTAPVARLVFTLTRDTRDSFLDATRGEFSSHSLELGPHFLGSETGFARYYGQYFRYVPLDKFLGRTLKDNEGRRIAPKLFYAGALRLALTSSFSGADLISPERFFAGGGTTMRGFQQDLLGPVVLQPDGTYRPTGGEGLFLFNNEIRFPIVSILQGVGFLDLGNVYPRLTDFNFSLRKSAGIGLRVKIKYIPLRFDYGYKLDRRPGESAGAFFFSIGQAF
jgi:outer membrane protein assembly complex protein YaeT